MKNIAVLWSGGLDSTYLVLKRLEEGYNVHAYYNEIVNNKYKTKAEYNAICNITNNLKIDYPTTFNVYGPVIKYDIMLGDKNSLKLTQPLFWSFSIPFILSYGINYEKIEIGYIQNDCAISFIDDIKSFLKCLNEFSHDYNFEKYISFPLIKTAKEEIFNIMRNNKIMKKYIKLTWTCEYPLIKTVNNIEKIKSCGKCKTCKQKKEAFENSFKK